MFRKIVAAALPLTFAAAIALPARSADANQVHVVYYSYDQVQLGDQQTYALLPHTTQIAAGYGWADMQKTAFDLLKRAKSATYGLSSVYVNPDRTVSVNLDESKRPYFSIIVGEVVFTLSELGAKAITFPAVSKSPIARADVATPAFTLVTPLWRTLPPTSVPPGLIRMPKGGLLDSGVVAERIATHHASILKATLGYLNSPNQSAVQSALAALAPLKVPNTDKVLLPLLKHASGDIRLSAVSALANSKSPAVLKALSERVGGDNDPRVTAKAATVLANSGVPEFASFALIHALRGADANAATDAARRLGGMKDSRAVPELARAARSPHPTLRAAAVDAIAAIGDHQVLKDLLSFSDVAADAKVRAASLLSSNPNQAMAQNGLAYLLLNALGDHSANAAVTLGKTRDPKVAPWLIQALKHSEEKTRMAAAAGLAAIGDPRALKPLSQSARVGGREGAHMAQQAITIMAAQSLDSLLALSGEQDEQIRRLATEALGHQVKKNPKRAARKAIPVLGQRVGDFSPSVRAAAVNGLGIAGGPSALPFIQQAAKDPDGNVRRSVAIALKSYSTPAGLDQLMALIDDEDDQVRLRAIETAQVRRDDKAVDKLVNYTRHGNPEIKRKVFQALAAVNPPRLHRSLREIFSEGVFDQDAEIRLAAVQGLQAIKDPRVLDIMSVLLQDPVLAVRIGTLQAYGISRYPQALQPLLASAQDPENPPEVRCAAYQALGILGQKAAIQHLIGARQAEKDVNCQKVIDVAVEQLKAM